MNVKLKICGMRDPANMAEVAALRPDYMGFIFYDKSPRYVGMEFKKPLLPPSVKSVGVFVNEKPETILDTISRHALDFAQLHGNETSEQCLELSGKGVKIIKAFAVDSGFDFESTRTYADYVSYFLFDTKGRYFGGNATPFDWTLLQKYDQQIPFFLSGGISAENVSAIRGISSKSLHSIDVNSGVETSPGRKDVKKIKELKRVISSY
jgi:phosphoribosylanthranilate isomerase